MRIMSGIQPTGSVHLGNYLGAIKNWVELQRRYDCFFAVVDLHALTTRPAAEDLRVATREIAIAVLACGVDPERSTLFVQSHVPEHTELAWLMSCMTQLGAHGHGPVVHIAEILDWAAGGPKPPALGGPAAG